MDIQIRYIAGGDPSSISDDFTAGEIVSVGRSLLAGTYLVTVNGIQCGGEFRIATELATMVVLSIAEAACGLTAGGPK